MRSREILAVRSPADLVILFRMAKDLPRKSWHLLHGQDAEHLAARYLESRGLVIIARNLRFKVGELDLVCLDDLVLVIVEVRQRRNDDFGGALASITHWKQRKLIRAAQCFLQRAKEWSHLPMRFDVVAITGLPHQDPEIEWVKQAFTI
jgi:putative endonuclease